jgi:hypothetical protein
MIQIGVKETVNLAKGPIVLEENDYLFAKAGCKRVCSLNSRNT